MPILIYFDSEKSAIYHAMTMTDDSVRSFCSLLSEKITNHRKVNESKIPNLAEHFILKICMPRMHCNKFMMIPLFKGAEKMMLYA